MRLAINSVALKDKGTPSKISNFMNELYSLFLGIDSGEISDLAKKMNTMRQSVLKIETVCYEMKLKE
ncbi:hypothetical protein MHBO_002146 [Bonamia ostreae]|uniref:Uncharacterized protein n=1 Tax=Bonamia ostreae TaxID=126728 RepID=A0ABV2ALC7_9EUKA